VFFCVLSALFCGPFIAEASPPIEADPTVSLDFRFLIFDFRLLPE
jgi:hypothetical protein